MKSDKNQSPLSNVREALKLAKDTIGFEAANRSFNNKPESKLAEIGAVVVTILKYALPADIFCRHGHSYHQVRSDYGEYTECRFCHIEPPDYREGAPDIMVGAH